MKWKSWCTGRSWEKNLKGKEFIEDKRKRSEIFGGTVRGGAILSGDGKLQDGLLRGRQYHRE